jgi:hypothetical protein
LALKRPLLLQLGLLGLKSQPTLFRLLCLALLPQLLLLFPPQDLETLGCGQRG